jgi:hypothetical protein
MKTLLAAFTIIMLGSGLTLGQDAAELAIVRSLLGVSSTTPLVSTRTAAFPANGPIKLFVDVSGDSPERDQMVKDYFLQWIEEWNREGSRQNAKLEIASDTSEAYVALIHFTDFPYAMDFVGGNATGEGEVNPRTGQPANTVQVSNTLRMSMTVYTYVIVREPNALKILYRRKDPVLSKTTFLASPTRSGEALASVRSEIEKEIGKRKSKAQGDKNSNTPGSKLRDEFAKWLKSGDGTTEKK